MKSQFLMAGLLSTYTTGTSNVAFAAPNTSQQAKICEMFEIQKNSRVIGNYESQSQDGTLFCAQLLRTDDHKMLEIVLHKKTKDNTINKYGDMIGDDERLYLITNPADSSNYQKAYIGITCNSSEGCATGETFIATMDPQSKELYLRMGEYSNNSEKKLSFLPEEIKEGLTFKPVK